MGTPMGKNNTIDARITKELFRVAMKGNWDKVIDIYQKHPNVHKEKITKSGQTALHIAVSDGQEQKVAKLVDIIVKHTPKKDDISATSEAKMDESTIADHQKTAASKIDKAKARFPALAVEDDRGNTPLHIAASLGSERMCECIAWANKDASLELIGARNHDGETPFFLAALHGHKDAFLRLHSIIISNPNKPGLEYCRKKDGETILHSAISGDYFDLAFQIIHLYKDFVNSVNEQGVTPLHLLASKPSAFRSGSHLGRFDKIIYHCIFVERLNEVKVEPFQTSTESTPSADKKKSSFPENYQTCCSIIGLLKKAVNVAIFRGKKEAETQPAGDTENPQGNSKFRPSDICICSKAIFRGKKEAETQPAGDTENPQGNSKFRLNDIFVCSKASGNSGAQGPQFFPPNYQNCFEFVKLVSKAMLVILGLGSNKIRKIREKKEKHTWSVQIMNELIDAVSFDYEDDGTRPSPGSTSSSIDLELLAEAPPSDQQDSTPPIDHISSDPNHNKDKENEKGKSKAEGGMTSKKEPPAKTDLTETLQKFLKEIPVAILSTSTDEKVLLSVGNRKEDIHTGMTSKKETPILIAAKNGITEIVQKILEKYPVAIQDMNTDKKNIVLLAVENRQPHVYQLLLKITTMKESVFRKVDNKGNSALHLAATLGEHKPWLIPGAALQMQWELKWYEFVKDSMPFHFFVRYNQDSKTPKDIFTETHSELVKAGGAWLTSTSESCSVVAALIATVAFATSATVPGGVKPESGTPTLQNQPAFNVFAVASLVALCFSVNAVIMFLSILTSRYQEKDFGEDLPRKLLIGLTSLFVSIASMLVSFCAGHFFVLKDKLKFAALPVYAVTCLPVSFFAVAQFPLYFDLAWATFKKVPQRSYKSIPL